MLFLSILQIFAGRGLQFEIHSGTLLIYEFCQLNPILRMNGRIDQHFAKANNKRKAVELEESSPVSLALPAGQCGLVINKPEIFRKFISLIKSQEFTTFNLGSDHLHIEISLYFSVALFIARWNFGDGFVSLLQAANTEDIQDNRGSFHSSRSYTFLTKTLSQALSAGSRYSMCVLAFGSNQLTIYYWNKKSVRHSLEIQIAVVDTPGEDNQTTFDAEHTGDLGLDYGFKCVVDVNDFKEHMLFKSGKTKEEKSKNGGNNRVNVSLEPAGQGQHTLSFLYKDTQWSARASYVIKARAISFQSPETHRSVLRWDYSEEMISVFLSFLELFGPTVSLAFDNSLPLQAFHKTAAGSYLVLLIGQMGEPE